MRTGILLSYGMTAYVNSFCSLLLLSHYDDDLENICQYLSPSEEVKTRIPGIITLHSEKLTVFWKNILGWLGDRTTAPSLLVRALYRCDHQAVQKVSWISCYNQCTLTPTGFDPDKVYYLSYVGKSHSYSPNIYMIKLHIIPI